MPALFEQKLHMFALRLSRVVNSLDCKPAQRLLSKITYSAGKVVETRDLIEFRCYRENEHHRNSKSNRLHFQQ